MESRFPVCALVIGENFGDSVNQNAIMNQLRQKLGIKVVLQMENSQGNVVFEETVTPNKQQEDGAFYRFSSGACDLIVFF